MIIDSQWIFIENEQPKLNTAGGAASLVVGTSTSTNVYDTFPLATGNVGILDWAAGDADKYFFWAVTGALAGAGAVVNVQLVSSASPTLSSPTVHRETGALAFNNAQFLTTANPHTWRVDPNDNWLRYIGVLFVISGANLVGAAPANSFTALMSNHVDAWKAYDSGLVFGY